MATTYGYLELTNGTISVLIMSSTGARVKYQLKYGEWAPKIAPRRKGRLGGVGDTQDVIEEMILNIRGDTPAECLSLVQDLHTLLLEAERWYANEPNHSPVILKYQIKGSSAAQALQCIVLGRVKGDNDRMLENPPTLSDTGDFYVIRDIRVRFWRRGKWLGASETQTSTSANNPSIRSVTFTDTLKIRSPTRIEMTGFVPGSGAGETSIIPRGFLIATNDDLKIKGPIVAEAVVGVPFIVITSGPGTSLSEINDTANLSQSTRILRLSVPTGGFADMYWTIQLTASFTQYGRVSFFFSCKNPSASVTWQMIPGVESTLFSLSTDVAAITIDNTYQNPRYVYGGTFIMDANRLRVCDRYTMYMTHNGTGTATIDFDALVVVAHDENEMIVSMSDLNTGQLAGGGNAVLMADHQMLTDPKPFFGGEQASGKGTVPTNRTSPASYNGVPICEIDGNECAAIWLATRGTYWRGVDNSNAAIANTLKATRTRGYITPE